MDRLHDDVLASERQDLRVAATAIPAVAESGGTPTLGRYYVTAVFDTQGTEAAVRVVCLPPTPERRLTDLVDSTSDPNQELERAAEALGLRVKYGVGPDQLIAAILATRPDPGVEVTPGQMRTGEVYDYLEHYPELIRFAASIALEPVVLVEMSPARATSIVELLRRGGTSAAVVSAVAAQQGVDPMLLIYASGSVILVGSAIGLARGMEAGMENVGLSLAARIRRWIDPSVRKTDVAELSERHVGPELSGPERHVGPGLSGPGASVDASED